MLISWLLIKKTKCKIYLVFNIFSKLGIYEAFLLFDQDSFCLYFWINLIFVKVNSDNQNKMKPVSVVEVYTTRFSHKFFLMKM